jgi:hypothetical protein
MEMVKVVLVSTEYPINKTIEWKYFVGFEVITAVVMKISIFWNIIPRRTLKFNDVQTEQVASNFGIEE